MSSISGGNGTKNFITDAGTAVEVNSTISIVGAGGITTSASGNTVTITGGGGGGITTIDGDTGSVTGSTVSLTTNELSNTTPQFTGSGTSMVLTFADANFNLILGEGNTSGTLTSGIANTGFGFDILNKVQNGNFNVALGYTNLGNLTSGSSNCAVGQQAGFFLTTGSFNTIVGGYQAGINYNANERSNVLLQNRGVAAENNTMRLGETGSGDGQVNATFIAGIDGTNVGSVAKVVTMASEQMGTATITAGSGISVTPGANTITIAATAASVVSWSTITADQAAVAGSGYFTNKAGTACSLSLPATSAVGDTFSVSNINAQGWVVTQGAGQQIFFGLGSSTLGATGTLASTLLGDSATLVCRTANTEWQVINYVGSIAVS